MIKHKPAKLLAWTGSPEDITLGGIYEIYDLMGHGRFRDNSGDPRDVSLGEWEEVEMTPALREGYKEGDLFVTLNDRFFEEGEVVELYWDDGTTVPEFRSKKNPGALWFLRLEDVRKLEPFEAESMMNKSFTLSDIESGMIVDTRNGKSFLAVENGWGDGKMAFIGIDSAYMQADFKSDLTSEISEQLDIVEVFNQGGWGCGFARNLNHPMNHFGRNPIWKREETVEIEGHKVSRRKLEEFLAHHSES